MNNSLASNSGKNIPKYLVYFDEKYEIKINYFHPAINNHLFNEPEFFGIHTNSKNDIYVQLVRKSDTKVFLTIAFYEINTGIFSSPNRGTFGGIGLNEKVKFEKVEKFISLISDFLKSRGAKSLLIRCAPASHNLTWFSIMFNVLQRKNFIIDLHEINFDLVIDERPYIERINYGNVKRIRKCIKNHFICENINHDQLIEVYEVIRDSRARLGLEVSMTYQQLKEMVTLFPKKVHLFSVYEDSSRSSMIASAVCMSLTDSIMYVLYWGDRADYSSYSPIALLASSIYEFCQKNKINLLDAGISTINSEPNYGLMQFKYNLGFTESSKIDFRLKL